MLEARPPALAQVDRGVLAAIVARPKGETSLHRGTFWIVSGSRRGVLIRVKVWTGDRHSLDLCRDQADGVKDTSSNHVVPGSSQTWRSISTLWAPLGGCAETLNCVQPLFPCGSGRDGVEPT